MNWVKAGTVGALGSLVIFIVMTLVLHLVYGLLNGWLIPRWVERPRTGEAA